MNVTTRESMSSSHRDGWGTPEDVLEPVYRVGDIELDPCANLRSVVKCKKRIALPQDGLAISWTTESEGLIFVNSPYGRQVKRWMEKCAAEARQGSEIISLVAARVDTKWFQDNIFGTANMVCFWKGRIRFIDLSTGQQGDPAFFPSAIAYWGENTTAFHEAFSDKGHIIRLR